VAFEAQDSSSDGVLVVICWSIWGVNLAMLNFDASKFIIYLDVDLDILDI
jgi:hypothetical protein